MDSFLQKGNDLCALSKQLESILNKYTILIIKGKRCTSTPACDCSATDSKNDSVPEKASQKQQKKVL